MSTPGSTYFEDAKSSYGRLARFISQFADSAFIRNLGAFATAEAANKVTRIVAMVVIARSLSVEAIGIAAIALTSFELIRIITNNGVGQMIVRASDDALEAVCARAHQLNVIACTAAGVLQIIAGLALWRFTGTPALMLMGVCLAMVFFGMPFGLVRIFRAMRRNRMDVVARINFYQVSSDNALSLLLAFCGFGAWALVLPKLLTFPIWLVGARRADGWRPAAGVAPAPVKDFRAFCAPVLATETLKGLRLHLDKAVIAALLGVEALGVYYFAFNAGLGLAQTLSLAFSACLYPQLCKALRRGEDVAAVWMNVTGVFAALATGLFILQIVAAPFYVPLVFGESWRMAVPIVVILCLAALPRFVSDCASQLARVAKLTALETGATFVSWLASMSAIAAGAALGGLTGAAVGLAAAAWIIDPAIALAIRNRARSARLQDAQ